MRREHPFIFIVIPMSEIKKYIIIELVVGMACYYVIRVSFHSILGAMAGSWFGPLLLRQSFKLKQVFSR